MSKLKIYNVHIRDPKTDEEWELQVRAANRKHADQQARDDYFGLFSPPQDEYDALEVTVT